MIAKLALLAVFAQACGSMQQALPSIAPRPETVVIVVHDSSPASHSKYIPNLRPNGTTKYDSALPWVAQYKAPAIYADWWKEIARCEKLEIPAELARKVKWVAVNSATFRVAPAYETLYGLTDTDAITIVIAQSKVLDKSVVMHEMAHMGNQWNGVDQGADYHPADSFEVCDLHTVYP
jgi:hypothetical protein